MIPYNLIELCASAGGAIEAALIVSAGNYRCLIFISSLWALQSGFFCHRIFVY
jgi:hypothetical protein